MAAVARVVSVAAVAAGEWALGSLPWVLDSSVDGS